jgi:MoxR-like ATPase
VLTRTDILTLQELVRRVPVAPHVIEHAVGIVRASRPNEGTAPEIVRHYVGFGAGPRASQALILGAKARAVLHGRYAAEIEDVRALVGPIMRHRIVLNFRGEAEGIRTMQVLEAIVRDRSA